MTDRTIALTRAGLLTAVRVLARRDRDLARIVERHGPPPLWARPRGFATLARIILEQQVSLAAAATLYRRLAEQVPGGITAEAVAALGPAGFRALGVTRQKSAYLCALAGQVTSGQLRLPALARASDEDVVRQLTGVPGIGPWTASIYLLMALRRPDVWPPGDLALHRALAALYARPAIGREEVARLAERWRPHRAVAARILWHGYLAERAR